MFLKTCKNSSNNNHQAKKPQTKLKKNTTCKDIHLLKPFCNSTSHSNSINNNQTYS